MRITKNKRRRLERWLLGGTDFRLLSYSFALLPKKPRLPKTMDSLFLSGLAYVPFITLSESSLSLEKGCKRRCTESVRRHGMAPSRGVSFQPFGGEVWRHPHSFVTHLVNEQKPSPPFTPKKKKDTPLASHARLNVHSNTQGPVSWAHHCWLVFTYKKGWLSRNNESPTGA